MREGEQIVILNLLKEDFISVNVSIRNAYGSFVYMIIFQLFFKFHDCFRTGIKADILFGSGKMKNVVVFPILHSAS